MVFSSRSCGGSTEDWDEELSKGSMIAPLDLDAALARWASITGAAARLIT